MTSSRPMLRVLPELRPPAEELRFCGYCGHPDETGVRICGSCHLGLVLTAPADVAPAPGEAAIVLDRTLSVCAMSEGAEALLGMREPDAVDRHVSELFVPAHAEARSLDLLVSTVVSAARGDVPVERMVVRPSGEFGIRYAMRIGACGPQPAALLVLDDDEV